MPETKAETMTAEAAAETPKHTGKGGKTAGMERDERSGSCAEGKYRVRGKPLTLGEIDVPIPCVSATSDHVVPLRSICKLHPLADTGVTFGLSNGGHDAGIVGAPGHEGRRYRIRTTGPTAPRLSPESRETAAAQRDGSRWPALVDWLEQRSSGKAAPPPMGKPEGDCRPIEDAPGAHVFRRQARPPGRGISALLRCANGRAGR